MSATPELLFSEAHRAFSALLKGDDFTFPLAKTACQEAMEADVAPARAASSCRLTKRFEGDDWKHLVERVPELLRRTFIAEACAALDVSEEAISGVELRLGSLYVTFHVTHDEDISEDEMERRIEEYPFHEMWRLYEQREGGADGLDAALQRLKDMEQELKDKDREMDKMRDDNAGQIEDLEQQIADLEDELHVKAAAREKDLLAELAKGQQDRKKAEGQLRGAEEERKKIQENLKREKQRFDKAAQRQNELIAAIIQENKKEKEAKEREFNEQLEVKDYIIENLKSQLRSRTNGDVTANTTIDNDQAEEFSRLMDRMESMASVLEESQQSESEARSDIAKLSEALRASEAEREAENVTYQNNVLALQQQLKAFRDTGIAEEHQKRTEARRSAGAVNVPKEIKENETIITRYEASLDNIITTLTDRLTILEEEFDSHLKVTQQSVDSETGILKEHEEDSKHIRKTFRQASLALQKIFWNTREGEVPAIIEELDTAASEAEKSSAAIKVALVMLDNMKKTFSDQSSWMKSHQDSVKELIDSLNKLNKRAFQRQLIQANDAVARGSSQQ